MGWEHRRNGRYYYRKRRVGGRVVSEYIGTGPLANAVATLDALDQQRRELERLAWREERDRVLAAGRAVDAVMDQVRTLTHAWLLAQGYHTHRGQWRKMRVGVSE